MDHKDSKQYFETHGGRHMIYIRIQITKSIEGLPEKY